MLSLQILQGSFRLNDIRTLTMDNVAIHTGESWAFVGANGSGKSTLARTGRQINGIGRRAAHGLSTHSPIVVGTSAASDGRRVAAGANTDLLSPGEEDTGSTAAEIIQQQEADDERCQHLASQFGIRHLLTRRFKYLSTGESRKVLLCQALMARPDLLILDEPLQGLDPFNRQLVRRWIDVLIGQGTSNCCSCPIMPRMRRNVLPTG
ncbi:ATP-binding cassette domain-containing protein [Sodalis glossinidius]|uniref:ATP-binding cassette domain-containing protein n=1 Tax=Sodalis glossinidius TaxID=63612 RepID=UPI00032629EB|nr:ATP-binding cassette domain-containing protein [Sodalis glossinidius]